MFVFGYPFLSTSIMPGYAWRRDPSPFGDRSAIWEPPTLERKPVLLEGSNRIISLWMKLDEAMFCVLWCFFLQNFVCWFLNFTFISSRVEPRSSASTVQRTWRSSFCCSKQKLPFYRYQLQGWHVLCFFKEIMWIFTKKNCHELMNIKLWWI